MAFTVGSLFSGIGMFDLGLERSGMRVLWQVEVDAWCRSVLARHWPDVERFADVRDVGRADLRPVDLICGGFPCQDISRAGRGDGGIRGARSGLWSEFHRIIGELRPRYVLVENASALKSRGLGVLLGELAAVGYDAEWDCLPAHSVGAPHERDRIWIVAYPRGSGRQQVSRGASGDEGANEGGSPKDNHLASGHGQGYRARNVADANGEFAPERRQRATASQEGLGWRDDGRGGAGSASRQESIRGPGESPRDALRRFAASQTWWEAEPRIRRVAYGGSRRLDERRNRAHGNAIVPHIAEWIGRRIMRFEMERAA